MRKPIQSVVSKNFNPSQNEYYRMGWNGSIVVSREKSALLDQKKQLSALFPPTFKVQKYPKIGMPKLTLPKPRREKSYKPALSFYKGALEKKEAAPIQYLLIETEEIAMAKPVLGSMQFLRSLARGKGILKRNAQGLVYLDIDNRFISSMLPLLKGQKLVRPPYYNLFDDPKGAHIPVISSRESTFHYLENVKELGEEFSFSIEGFYSIEPTLWPEAEQVWFFTLKSEGLEKLRRKYHLTEHPNGNPFHIVVAIKPQVSKLTKKALPSMRINIGCLVA